MATDQFSPSWARGFRCSCLSGRFPAPGSRLTTMASADFPRHFLRGISPGKNALRPGTTVAFTSTSKPVDFAVWCQLIPRVGLAMRFLFIGLSVSPSLPPPGRLPSRSWLQVVVSSFSCSVFLQGTLTPFATRPCWAHTMRCSEPGMASWFLIVASRVPGR